MKRRGLRMIDAFCIAFPQELHGMRRLESGTPSLDWSVLSLGGEKLSACIDEAV